MFNTVTELLHLRNESTHAYIHAHIYVRTYVFIYIYIYSAGYFLASDMTMPSVSQEEMARGAYRSIDAYHVIAGIAS